MSTASSQKSKPKNTSVVVLRVLGMLLIILCHIIHYYSFIPGSQFLGQVFNVGVQVFLIISGYLYGGKIIQGFGKWFGQRWLKIALPTLILCLIDTAVLAIIGSEEAVGFKTLLPYLLCMQGLPFLFPSLSDWIGEIHNVGPLWFITIIMVCYALVPLLQFIKLQAKKKNVSSGLLFVIVLLLFALSLILEAFTGITLYYLAVFVIGYLLGDINFGGESKIKLPLFCISTIIMLAVQVLRLAMRNAFDDSGLYVSVVSFAQTVLGGWICMFIFWLHSIAPRFIDALGQSPLMKWLDKMSFFIYMVHGIFCVGTTFNTFVLIGNIWLATLAFFACSVAAAFVLYGIHSGIMHLINLIGSQKRKSLN